MEKACHLELDFSLYVILFISFVVFSILPTHIYYAFRGESGLITVVSFLFIAAVLLDFVSGVLNSAPGGNAVRSALSYTILLCWALSFIEIKLRRW
jgi:hypothetical protein